MSKIDVFLVTEDLTGWEYIFSWITGWARHTALVFRCEGKSNLIRIELTDIDAGTKGYSILTDKIDSIAAVGGREIHHVGSFVGDPDKFVNELHSEGLAWLLQGLYNAGWRNCRTFTNRLLCLITGKESFKAPDLPGKEHLAERQIRSIGAHRDRSLRKNAINTVTGRHRKSFPRVKKIEGDQAIPEPKESPVAVVSDSVALGSQGHEQEYTSKKQSVIADSTEEMIKSTSENENPGTSGAADTRNGKDRSDQLAPRQPVEKVHQCATQEPDSLGRFKLAALRGAAYGAGYSMVANWKRDITYSEFARLVMVDMMKYSSLAVASETLPGDQMFLILTAVKEAYLDCRVSSECRQASPLAIVFKSSVRVTCRLFDYALPIAGKASYPISAARGFVLGIADGYVREKPPVDEGRQITRATC